MMHRNISRVSVTNHLQRIQRPSREAFTGVAVASTAAAIAAWVAHRSRRTVREMAR